MEVTRHGSRSIKKLLLLLLIAGTSAGAQAELPVTPTPYDKYELLWGEGYSGAGFLIRYGEWLVAVTSRHQFDGKVPNQLESIKTDEVIALDTSRVVKQWDVQSMLVANPKPEMQFLAYDPNYTLHAKEHIYLVKHDRCVGGFIQPQNLFRDTYTSREGRKKLQAFMVLGRRMAGLSGAPVILKRTGTVVGVVLGADDPDHASYVEFETLCLPPVAPKAQAKAAPSPAAAPAAPREIK